MADPLPDSLPAPEPPARTSNAVIRRLAAALHHRDFRLLWIGAFTSTTGTWVQKVAQSWLVATLTGSALYLGFDAFLGELPFLLFTLIGGVVADRHSRRHLLIGSQCVQMSCAFTLAALVYWDVVHIWHILTLSFVSGIAQAFGGPAYQSLIPSLVPKRELPNAIALNSIQFNLARTIGPAIAGPTLALLGTAACFGLNGLSFLMVIGALLMLHVAHTVPLRRQRLVDELRGGLSYVRHEHSIRTLMALSFASAFLALPLQTFLPIFAQNVFQGGADVYARLMTCSGIGAVTGGLVVAWLGRTHRLGTTLLSALATLGGLVLLFSLSRNLPLSYLLLYLTSVSSMIVLSLTTSLVQMIAPDQMRGRVMSIYMVAFRGGWPLGSLLAGVLISRSAAPAVLAANGTVLLLIGLYLRLIHHHGVKSL